ncbi:Unknown protein [Striga hermonthica]|uniref:Uncharacterized protein n=1 Tax=Striga hermonthica TaxID=68872 RepID=A0A9N7MZC3_STRHE|nr:Unknown protein [Striga hermonthica]
MFEFSPKKWQTVTRQEKCQRRGGDHRIGLSGPNGKTLDRVSGPNIITENDEKNVPFARSPIRAPLGVPLCPAGIGGSRWSLPVTGGYGGCMSVGTLCDGALLDSRALRERMEHIALGQGLVEGVSLDCANTLSQGLDCYMREVN